MLNCVKLNCVKVNSVITLDTDKSIRVLGIAVVSLRCAKNDKNQRNVINMNSVTGNVLMCLANPNRPIAHGSAATVVQGLSERSESSFDTRECASLIRAR